MTVTCAVCSKPFGAPIFESSEAKSLTTMNVLIDGKTTVYFCDNCHHGQTNELPDLVTYYDQEYEINIDSEESDQLYDVVDGKEVYRSEHQARVLMSKVDLSQHRKVLDYGCAKAPTLRAICSKIPEVEPYLFDVTDKYVRFWAKFSEEPNWATHTPDPDWKGQMDVVLSFYALEHIPRLTDILTEVRDLLKEGGYFYFIVPDMYQNAADFIVADHVNHFSTQSLWHLMAKNGFTAIEIDTEAHASAYVVSAHRAASDAPMPTPPDFVDKTSEALALAQFWHDIKVRISSFEAKVSPDVPLVIYGAGIYGNFIFSCLKNPKKVTHFLDQNTFLAGTKIHGCPIITPDDLLYDSAAILVGLNPRNARRIIEDIKSLKNASHTFLFLS